MFLLTSESINFTTYSSGKPTHLCQQFFSQIEVCLLSKTWTVFFSLAHGYFSPVVLTMQFLLLLQRSFCTHTLSCCYCVGKITGEQANGTQAERLRLP
jgi:hypothetical protein